MDNLEIRINKEVIAGTKVVKDILKNVLYGQLSRRIRREYNLIENNKEHNTINIAVDISKLLIGTYFAYKNLSTFGTIFVGCTLATSFVGKFNDYKGYMLESSKEKDLYLGSLPLEFLYGISNYFVKNIVKIGKFFESIYIRKIK
jgi:hypothetical protein